MNLPKFKNFISNTIAHCIFDNFNIYEENLYSKDSNFEVSMQKFDHVNRANKEDMEAFFVGYKALRDSVESLNKTPAKETIINNDFSFVIHFDSNSIGTGISLKQLKKMSNKLHTDLIFVNGDGNDYQLGEFTGGHDSEVIVHIQFTGPKDKLINDYNDWYLQRHDYLAKKIEEKAKKNKLKK